MFTLESQAIYFGNLAFREVEIYIFDEISNFSSLYVNMAI